MKRVKRLMGTIIILWCVCALAACSAATSAGDHFTMSATPEGMRAFADLSNGLIRTGKESAEQPSEFFAHRKTQEANETERHGHATGFWQKLVN